MTKRYTLAGELMPEDRRRFVTQLEIDGDERLTADTVRAALALGLSSLVGVKKVNASTTEYMPR